MKLGDFEVEILSEGCFKIDGGAMFGLIPRTIWEKIIIPDKHHKIMLNLTMLLVKTPNGNIWIETGVGDNCDPKWLRVYEIYRENHISELLKKHKLKPENIKYVILTHLHFDHCGGIAAPGLEELCFPQARYVIQTAEWMEATNPNLRLKDSYPVKELKLLAAKERLHLVQGSAEIIPGVKVEKTGGHSKGHQIIHLESKGEHLVFAGDLIPLTGNLRLKWISAIDYNPEESLEQKQKLLKTAAEQNWLIAFGHSAEYGYLKAKEDKYELVLEQG